MTNSISVVLSIALLILLSSCKQPSQQTATQEVTPEETVIEGKQVKPMKGETHSLDYCMGKFDPSKDERFVSVDQMYADRAGMLIRKEAYDAFLQMYAAAKQASVTLQIRSATRNFNYQKGIWERKWKGDFTLSEAAKSSTEVAEVEKAVEIMNYSAMPGASRHHWGTDIDLNSFVNSYFESGPGLKVYEWLRQNAHAYGYCQPYTSKETGRTGYNEEKWHWSYTPLSDGMTAYVSTHMHDHDLQGFSGAAAAGKLSVVQRYVLGLDPSCLGKSAK